MNAQAIARMRQCVAPAMLALLAALPGCTTSSAPHAPLQAAARIDRMSWGV